MIAHTPDRFKQEEIERREAEDAIDQMRPAMIAWMAITEAIRRAFGAYDGLSPQQTDLLWQCFLMIKFTCFLEMGLHIREWDEAHKEESKKELKHLINMLTHRAADEGLKAGELVQNLQEMFPASKE